MSLQHGFGDGRKADGIVNVIQVAVMKRLKGWNSNKRRLIFERAFKEANIEVRQLILIVITRRN